MKRAICLSVTLEIQTLRDEEQDNLEGPLTYGECRKALETFQNDKAPGEDGFTIEIINISLIYKGIIY